MVNLFNLTNKQKVRYTLITYVLTICSALCFIVLNNISSPYFNIGPSEKLIIFNIKIDTPSKYVYSQLFMIYINFIEIISVEGAAPILYFRIFNPDLKTINDFTKNVAMVPCSAKIGEGIEELLFTLCGLSQKFLKERLKLAEEGGKGVILEVKKEKTMRKKRKGSNI